jgi:hypothetical protein
MLGIVLVRFTPVRTALAALLVALVATAPAAAKGPTPRGELQRLQKAGRLDAAQATQYRASYDAARRTLKKLKGFRHVQLAAVVENVDRVAADHLFAPTRAAGRLPHAGAQPGVVGVLAAALPRPARDLRAQPGRLAVLPRPGLADPVAGDVRQGQRVVDGQDP